MKLFVSLALLSILAVALISGWGIFVIIPQPIEIKQMAFMGITALTLVALIFLHMNQQGKKALYLFFFMYPFLAQSVHYINLSSSFFVITPPLIFLGVHALLRRDHWPTRPLLIVLLFSLSTLLSVVLAANPYTAMAYFILGVGGFVISAYLVYLDIRAARNPTQFIFGLIFSILIGSMVYLVVETVAFRIQPSDIILIITRRWGLLSQGRYFSGGYREPVGIGYVYSILFWFLILFVQDSRLGMGQRRIAQGAILFVGFILLIMGARSAMFNLVDVFLVLWVLQKQARVRRLYTFRPWHLAILAVLLGISIYLLLPRTILTDRSQPLPNWIKPTYVTVFGKTYQLVGTTTEYYERTVLTWQDFINNPIGAGPLNIYTAPKPGTEYSNLIYYSFITNLITTGATFGWLSLGIWIIFLGYATLKLFQLRKTPHRELLPYAVLFLAILLGLHLPGASYIGPGLNWNRFDSYGPLTPSTKGLPAEYTAIISGVIVGGLAALLDRLRWSKAPTPEIVPGRQEVQSPQQGKKRGAMQPLTGIAYDP